ncbi:uncharacterized protein [Hoplias malabaricus]|uniref:uncharacterized protein n=1 Tax=Hoplias malabaricus TaxID=27720 RepID=UPI0034636DF6
MLGGKQCLYMEHLKVRCGVLTGLVLRSLLSVAVSVDINIQTLRRIFNHLQTNSANQFAVAINVPAAKCAADARPDQNFVTDNLQRVRAAMNSARKVYNGRQLIAAKPRPIPETTDKHHSEYLLLINSNLPNDPRNNPRSGRSLMGQLLNRERNGYVVFYTYNSPCLARCLSPETLQSIIPALNMFHQHRGPKAFVFHQSFG